jgi:hypothetical protein
MKVIQSGKPGSAWSKEYVCTGKGNGENGCKAILEVEGGDLFHTCSFAMGERSDYITFECPECHEWTDISSNDMPYGLRRNVFNQEQRIRPRHNHESN